MSCVDENRHASLEKYVSLSLCADVSRLQVVLSKSRMLVVTTTILQVWVCVYVHYAST